MRSGRLERRGKFLRNGEGGEILLNNEDRESLQGFIVLGARLNQQGLPGRVGKMRLCHGLARWQEQGAEGYVILTGGRHPGMPVSEAQGMAVYALRWAEEEGGAELRDILGQRLILEEASLNTAASAQHTLPLVQTLNLSAVGLVSDALHIHRAYYIFGRHFSPHGISLHPLVAPGVLRSYWQQRGYLRLGKMALREGGAWAKALVEGWGRRWRR